MGNIIKVKVKTNKPETRITGKNGDILLIDLNAKPEKNQANIELIKFFRKKFKQDVRIIRGLKSKQKILLSS